MANPLQQRDVMGLVDKLDQAVAEMLPRPYELVSGARGADAARKFAGAVGELEGFFRQLQELKPVLSGPGQAREVEDLQSEIQEKRLSIISCLHKRIVGLLAPMLRPAGSTITTTFAALSLCPQRQS
ncbi:hypothetical protein VaNZ11_008830 [Volvox africanus]|uniref:Mediator of RNA polymerase II transcription subunit 9 n=1 Tax=Volvox africanus TaxID=51714 RepID=A0ABQ5S7A8_9CHLO|nr:hypothetical protein VaNZ11_008830 [Volvox africanus]